MADKPKARYTRATWNYLKECASPAFFYEHEFGSPIEPDSDNNGSPQSVIEAPIAEQPSSAAVTSTTKDKAPTPTASDFPCPPANTSPESRLTQADFEDLIRNYRSKIAHIPDVSPDLRNAINHPPLSIATPSSVLAAGVQASSPTTPSLEERLSRASLNAKANSSSDNKAKSSIPLAASEVGISRGRRIDSKRKERNRDPTPILKNPRGLPVPALPNKSNKPECNLDLNPEIRYLLEYQRGVYSGATTLVPPNIPSGGIIGHVAKMINAKAISALLSENVDENTSDWALFTNHGNLLGHSSNTPSQQARTVASTAGAAWRTHSEALANDDQEIRDKAKKFGRMLELIPYDDEAGVGLRALILVIDGFVVAVHDVKERLLIAAMLPLLVCEAGEEGEPVGKGKGKGKAEVGGGKDEEEGNGKAEEGEGANKVEAEEQGGKPTTKRQILVWRAEGMAEALLADLVGFKMPEGYF